MGDAILALIVLSMIWVGVDARRRDWTRGGLTAKTATGQLIGVVLLWPVFFPLYLFERRRAPRKG